MIVDNSHQLPSTLATHQSLLITAHERPDLDAIGSCLALATHLSHTHDVTVWLGDIAPPNPIFDNQIPIVTKRPDTAFDALIICDCSNFDRIYKWEDHRDPLLRSHPVVVNIDHHPDNTHFGTLNIHSHLSSVCEMLTHMFNEHNWTITPQIATYLYAGIAFDTDRFLHSNTTSTTLKVAAQLHDQGADISFCHSFLYETLTPDTMELMKVALNNLEIHPNIQTAITTLPKKFDHLPYKPIDLIRQIKETDISIVISETPHYVKASLRSKTDFSVSELAQQFGGGGHHKAAGIEFKNRTVQQVKKILLDAIGTLRT